MFWKKKNNDIKIFAPLAGKIIQLEKVPDPVFSEKMMGDGVAIVPTDNVVIAPFDGVVKMIMKESKHAIGIVNEDGMEILIHIGLETVTLGGQCFELFIGEGEKIKKGDKLIAFDNEKLSMQGIDTTTMIIVTNDNNLKQITKMNNEDIVDYDSIIMSYKKN